MPAADVVPTPAWRVVLAVAWRSLLRDLTRPSLTIPLLAFPLFFLAAFASGLALIARTPGFEFAAGYTAFEFVFVVMQTAAFGGTLVAAVVAEDVQSGVARRLLLAAARPSAILAGTVLAALGRFLTVTAILTAVAVLAGMQVLGSPFELALLLVLGSSVNAAATLWGLGVALRVHGGQAQPLMQAPVFVFLFLAPVYVPLGLLTGWIHAIASINPLTVLLDAGRGLIAGAPPLVWPALAVGLALDGASWWWASRGVRRLRAGN
jgi:ABC-2 type transport system permease protein